MNTPSINNPKSFTNDHNLFNFGTKTTDFDLEKLISHLDPSNPDGVFSRLSIQQRSQNTQKRNRHQQFFTIYFSELKNDYEKLYGNGF